MSNPLDVVKRYGRIQLMVPPRPSDAYNVVLVDAATPNRHALIGSLAREASTLQDVVLFLHSKVNSNRAAQEDMKRGIEAASDGSARERLEYHLRQHEWFARHIAAALQEIEASYPVNRDDEC